MWLFGVPLIGTLLFFIAVLVQKRHARTSANLQQTRIENALVLRADWEDFRGSWIKYIVVVQFLLYSWKFVQFVCRPEYQRWVNENKPSGEDFQNHIGNVVHMTHSPNRWVVGAHFVAALLWIGGSLIQKLLVGAMVLSNDATVTATIHSTEPTDSTHPKRHASLLYPLYALVWKGRHLWRPLHRAIGYTLASGAGCTALTGFALSTVYSTNAPLAVFLQVLSLEFSWLALCVVSAARSKRWGDHRLWANLLFYHGSIISFITEAAIYVAQRFLWPHDTRLAELVATLLGQFWGFYAYFLENHKLQALQRP